MNKKSLSERDICTKFISPAVQSAGWDTQSQVREEVHFTKGRINVRGKMVSMGKDKFADYILYYRPNIPIALIEAKNNNLPVGSGMQQGLGYAETLDIPFVFSSNGDGFILHDRTGQSNDTEVELTLEEFPSPVSLWARYKEVALHRNSDGAVEVVGIRQGKDSQSSPRRVFIFCRSDFFSAAQPIVPPPPIPH